MLWTIWGQSEQSLNKVVTWTNTLVDYESERYIFDHAMKMRECDVTAVSHEAMRTLTQCEQQTRVLRALIMTERRDFIKDEPWGYQGEEPSK